MEERACALDARGAPHGTIDRTRIAVEPLGARASLCPSFDRLKLRDTLRTRVAGLCGPATARFNECTFRPPAPQRRPRGGLLTVLQTVLMVDGANLARFPKETSVGDHLFCIK